MDRDSMGRDMLGELRDAFPPPNDARDGPMSSSWAGDRRRMDSSDSVHSKDVSGVSDWSVEVEEEDQPWGGLGDSGHYHLEVESNISDFLGS